MMKVDLAVEGCVSLITYHGSCVRFYSSTGWWCPAIFIFIPGFWYNVIAQGSRRLKAGDRFTDLLAALLRCYYARCFVYWLFPIDYCVQIDCMHTIHTYISISLLFAVTQQYSSVSVLAFHIDCIALLALAFPQPTLCIPLLTFPLLFSL